MNKIIVIIALFVVVIAIKRPETKFMPMMALNVHAQGAFAGGSEFVGGGCSTKKCLIVYVAPWCPTCQVITPTITSLANEMRSEGMTVTVVVGKDSPDNVEEYADKFPFPVLTDTDGRYYYQAKLIGVPYLAITNGDGKIINEYFGGYTSVNAFREKLKI